MADTKVYAVSDTAMTRACCQAMSNMIANNPTIAQEYLPRKLEREAKYQMFL